MVPEDSRARTPDGEDWFSDGNIDIVAEDTVFRVHRAVLFRGMLSIPQPTGADNSAPCPSSVEVTDSADDMRHLLLAIYNSNP